MSSFTVEPGLTGPTGATGPSLASVTFPTTPKLDIYGRTVVGADWICPWHQANPFTVSAGQVAAAGPANLFSDGLFNPTEDDGVSPSFVGGSLEQYITCDVVNTASSNAEQVLFYFADSTNNATYNGHQVELHATGGNKTVLNRVTAGTIALVTSGTVAMTLANGDQIGVRWRRNGSAVFADVYKNGVFVETLTDASPPGTVAQTTTPLFFGFEVGDRATIRLSNFGGGVTVSDGRGATGPTGTGPAGVTGPTGTVTGATGATGPVQDCSVVGGRQFYVAGADVTTATGNGVAIGWLVNTNVAASRTYIVDFWLRASSAAATTGYFVDVTSDAATTSISVVLQFFHQLATGGTTTGGAAQGSGPVTNAGKSSGVPLANSVNLIRGRAIIACGAGSGITQFELRPGAEVAASVTFKAGSVMVVTRVV